MLLFTPDRHITPDDPEPEIEPYSICCVCDKYVLDSNGVKDFIGENVMCNNKRCITASMEIDIEELEGSELIKAQEYYDKLLNELK